MKMKFLNFILIFVPVIASTMENCAQQRWTKEIIPFRNVNITKSTTYPYYYFPWMATVRFYLTSPYNLVMGCSATLIDSRHLLSLAHCLFRYENEKQSVKDSYIDPTLGGRSVFKIKHLEIFLGSTYQKSINIEYIRIHPKWDGIKGSMNDLAVIRLTKKVKFTDEISPVCLPQNERKTFENINCYAMGRGPIENVNSKATNYSERKVIVEKNEKNSQELNIRYLQSSDCYDYFGGQLFCSDLKKKIWYQYGLTIQKSSRNNVFPNRNESEQEKQNEYALETCKNGAALPFRRITVYKDWIVEAIKILEKNDKCLREKWPNNKSCMKKASSSAGSFNFEANRKIFNVLLVILSIRYIL